MGDDDHSYINSKKGNAITTGEVVFPSPVATINNAIFPSYYFAGTANQIIHASKRKCGTQADPYKIDWTVNDPDNEVSIIMELPLVNFPALDFVNFSYDPNT